MSVPEYKEPCLPLRYCSFLRHLSDPIYLDCVKQMYVYGAFCNFHQIVSLIKIKCFVHPHCVRDVHQAS